MRAFRRLRTGRPSRAFRHATTVIATLIAASGLAVGLSAALPSTTHAATAIWGDYGGGRLLGVDPQGGYWVSSPSGSVTPYAGAPSFGSPASMGVHLSKPVVGMAPTPSGAGYWLVASDGGIFSFGDAHFFGSTGGIHLNQPIVGMAPLPTGIGYWLVASDGGVFSFGFANFYGSTGSIHLNQPIVGMASTPDGRGYWLVASDGGIFSYGDAAFYGSTGSIHLNQPIVAMAPTPTGHGYWLVASDGGIFSFGDAAFYGSLGGTGSTVLGMDINAATGGYILVQANGTATSFNPSNTGFVPVSSNAQPVEIGGGAQGPDCVPAVQPAATTDWSLNNVFSNQPGPGWLGADMGYSTALPNGQESFVFSDTLIGTAQPDGQASLTGITRNSEFVGNLPNMNTDIGGTYGWPSSLIPNSGNDHWWTAATYVENGSQLVYVNQFVQNSGLDSFTGQSGIAVFSVPGSGMPALESIVPLPTDSNTQWGSAVFQSGGYNYVYGLDSQNGFGGMKLGRVPVGESLQTNDWTYWNGAGWVGGEANAVAINTGAQLTSVLPQAGGSGYVGVGIPGGAFGGSSITLSYSCSPTGPWSAPQAVYSIPQISQWSGEFAYTPIFHPEIDGQGGLVVSYSINSTSLNDVIQNVHRYQPQFIVLSN